MLKADRLGLALEVQSILKSNNMDLSLLLLAIPHCKIIRQPEVGKIGKIQFTNKCHLRIFFRCLYAKLDTFLFSYKYSPGIPAVGRYLCMITYMVTETDWLLLRGV